MEQDTFPEETTRNEKTTDAEISETAASTGSADPVADGEPTGSTGSAEPTGSAGSAEPTGSADPAADAGEAEIFARQRNERAQKRRRNLIVLACAVVVILVIVIVSVISLRQKVSDEFSRGGDEIVSAEVIRGSVATTVSGSGTLADSDTETVEISSALEIADVCVEKGDTVEAGDLIATVTNYSLTSAMAEIQDALDALDTEITGAAGDTVSSTITASAAGRVKKVYAEAGDAVRDVMYEHGALMLLSLDGYLAADVASDNYHAGDSVVVTASGGSSYEGTVEKVVLGVATVLITDQGTTVGDTVTVGDATSELYIHKELAVTGYAGTIKKISVSEESTVKVGSTLITLTDTGTSANYDSLLESRAELEAVLADLIAIAKEGGIVSPVSGTVSELQDTDALGTSASSAAASSGSAAQSYTTLATVVPGEHMSLTLSVDETDILALEIGQTARVSVDALEESSFVGSVTDIDTTATSGSGVSTYAATVTIDKTETMLAGMSASAVIEIEGVEDALLIPVEALHQTSATSYVYTAYDETTGEFSGMTEIICGLSDGSYVEVLSGLSEGDTVWYSSGSAGMEPEGFVYNIGEMGEFGDRGAPGDDGSVTYNFVMDDNGEFQLEGMPDMGGGGSLGAAPGDVSSGV